MASDVADTGGARLKDTSSVNANFDSLCDNRAREAGEALYQIFRQHKQHHIRLVFIQT